MNSATRSPFTEGRLVGPLGRTRLIGRRGGPSDPDGPAAGPLSSRAGPCPAAHTDRIVHELAGRSWWMRRPRPHFRGQGRFRPQHAWIKEGAQPRTPQQPPIRSTPPRQRIRPVHVDSAPPGGADVTAGARQPLWRGAPFGGDAAVPPPPPAGSPPRAAGQSWRIRQPPPPFRGRSCWNRARGSTIGTGVRWDWGRRVE